MIKKLQNLVYKEADKRYVDCHNEIRCIIEDNVGTIDKDVVDEIICIVIENYV